MKRFGIILMMLVLTGLVGMAASRLYQGNSTYSGNILYTCDGKHVYQGNSTYSGNILYTWDGIIPVPLLLAMTGIM